MPLTEAVDNVLYPEDLNYAKQYSTIIAHSPTHTGENKHNRYNLQSSDTEHQYQDIRNNENKHGKANSS